MKYIIKKSSSVRVSSFYKTIKWFFFGYISAFKYDLCHTIHISYSHWKLSCEFIFNFLYQRGLFSSYLSPHVFPFPYILAPHFLCNWLTIFFCIFEYPIIFLFILFFPYFSLFNRHHHGKFSHIGYRGKICIMYWGNNGAKNTGKHHKNRAAAWKHA